MEDKNLATWEEHKNNVFMALLFLDNVIVKTEGVYIIDTNGKKIMDFASGTCCSLLGHNHPKLVERLKKQLDISIHTGSAYLNKPFFDAISKLTTVLPEGLNKIVFFCTGTEANEAAIKIAKEYTGRYGILGFDKGHLGTSFLMQQASLCNPAKPSCKPRISCLHKMLTPSCSRCPVKARYPECDFLCIKISEKRLKFRLNKIAAIIAEPVISEAGIIVPPVGYFKRLKQMLDRHGILLIIDEAQTNLGRTGKWFGIEHHDVVPDILVASKQCGGGYPVSMVATNAKIQDKLIRNGFTHLTSHMNDPLGAEAVSAVIDIIREENLVENARKEGAYLFDMLIQIKKEFPQVISDVRGIGLMIGIELGNYKDERPAQIGARLAYTLIENGLNINWFSPDVLIFEPPLIITDIDIKEAVEILRKSIKEVMEDRTKNSGIFRKNELSAFAERMMSEKQPFFRRVIKRVFAG
jgi:2,2-dialkylglycine decarboxylase (pyruvate)